MSTNSFDHEKINEVIAHLVTKHDLGAYEHILRDILFEVYSKGSSVRLEKDIKKSSVVWDDSEFKHPPFIVLRVSPRNHPEDILWSLFHEAKHLAQGQPPRTMPDEERFNRESSAWDIAESHIIKHKELLSKLYLFKEYKAWCLATYAQ